MNIYWVCVDNGLEYEDYKEESFIVAANSEEEAKKIGLELFDNIWWKNFGVNSNVTLITETHNGHKLMLL
jgi:hypothetical protein